MFTNLKTFHKINLYKLTLIDSDYSRNCIKYKDALDAKKILNSTNSRHVTSFMHKLGLNSFRTKHTKNNRCTCGEFISANHLLIQCPIIKAQTTAYLIKTLNNTASLSTEKCLNDLDLLEYFAKILYSSPVSIFL